MKTISMIGLLTIFVSANAFASTTKICFGVGEAKGERFRIEVSEELAVVTEVNGNSYEYPLKKEIKGKDGKTYISYNVFDDETWTEFLVDQALLTKSGQGYVKYRWQGESFAQRTFFCREDQF